MASININGDSSGSITLSAPTVAGSNTQTLPAATGTVMVSGNMPAFSAYLSASQSVTSTVVTKIAFNTKEFDTASCFDATTNYRFTPTVAGYYQVNIVLLCNATTSSLNLTSLYKNGAQFKTADNRPSTSGGVNITNTISVIVSMNGTTDYLEVYNRIDGTSPSIIGLSTGSTFSASLVRAA